MAFFAVTVVYGPTWDHGRGRREQDGWDEHATFMDDLVEAGFVVLGGPVGDGTDVLLAVEAGDEDEIRSRLAADPWEVSGRLRVGEIRPWTVWLDGRSAPRPA